MALTDWSHRAHLDDAPAAERGNGVRLLGLGYGLSAFVVMWAFWAYFVVFLANAPSLRAPWASPSVDVGATLDHPALAALVNLGLIALFGLQHSLMARPRLKAWWAAAIPPAFVRVTYVHAANAALWVLVLFWQPLPGIIWQADGILRVALWTLFVLGWITLLAGAVSFGLLELLGIDRVWSWYRDLPEKAPAPQDPLAVRLGSPSHVRWRSARRLGDAAHDGRPRAAGSGPHPLRHDRHALRGARPEGRVRRGLPALALGLRDFEGASLQSSSHVRTVGL